MRGDIAGDGDGDGGGDSGGGTVAATVAATVAWRRYGAGDGGVAATAAADNRARQPRTDALYSAPDFRARPGAAGQTTNRRRATVRGATINR
ncbi:MAG: hypothetical protein OXU71_02235 [Gammaproteobacteria bacterium]|nr:hypothetical protein [Gammaproteobacteria bacterium]